MYPSGCPEKANVKVFLKVLIQVWSMPWTMKLVAICDSSHQAWCEYAIWTAYPKWLQRKVNIRVFPKCSHKYDWSNQPWSYQCVCNMNSLSPVVAEKSQSLSFFTVIVQVWQVRSTMKFFIICDSSHQVQCVCNMNCATPVVAEKRQC